VFIQRQKEEKENSILSILISNQSQQASKKSISMSSNFKNTPE
jgi:hypothetical protein